MLDLSASDQQTVVKIIRQYLPEATIYAFGSRAQGMAKAHSDLDVLLDGVKEVSLLQRASLSMAFEESDLPMRVDWMLGCEAPAHFLEMARRMNLILV